MLLIWCLRSHYNWGSIWFPQGLWHWVSRILQVLNHHYYHHCVIFPLSLWTHHVLGSSIVWHLKPVVSNHTFSFFSFHFFSCLSLFYFRLFSFIFIYLHLSSCIFIYFHYLIIYFLFIAIIRNPRLRNQLQREDQVQPFKMVLKMMMKRLPQDRRTR